MIGVEINIGSKYVGLFTDFETTAVLQRAIEKAILATPTGSERETLTVINLKLLEQQEHWSPRNHAEPRDKPTDSQR